MVVANEAITYLFRQHGTKYLLPTGVVILIFTSVNHEERKEAAHQARAKKVIVSIEEVQMEPKAAGKSSQGMIQRPGPRWLEMLITHLQEMESWGWCGKEKIPSGFNRSTPKVTQKVQTKASPHLPPPTLQ